MNHLPAVHESSSLEHRLRKKGLSGVEILDGMVNIATILEQESTVKDVENWIYWNPLCNRKRLDQVYAIMQRLSLTETPHDRPMPFFLFSSLYEMNAERISQVLPWMRKMRPTFQMTENTRGHDLVLHFTTTQSIGYFTPGAWKEYLEELGCPRSVSWIASKIQDLRSFAAGKRSESTTQEEIRIILEQNKQNIDGSTVTFAHEPGDIYTYRNRIFHRESHGDYGHITLFLGGVISDENGIVAYGFCQDSKDTVERRVIKG